MNLHRMGQSLWAATHPESQVVSDLLVSPPLLFNLLLASVIVRLVQHMAHKATRSLIHPGKGRRK